MAQEIRDFATPSCELLALGEPTHQEPAFPLARNELFAQLVVGDPFHRGFRSIALETDRVAALAVDDFVREGTGTLDGAMSEGFSHGFGELDANRRLVAWMREYNEGRSTDERLAFHGIDAPLEFTGASPRSYLEYARDYLGLDLDLANLVGDDERWNSDEAVMDPAASPGDSADARKLRAIADDMLTALYARAPELIAATSRADWRRAKIHLTSALGLLRYHRQAAQRIENSDRWSRLSAVRDALMAQNLLDIRSIEADRGPTLVFANNVHLQRNVSHMSMAGMELTWFGTGAIIASLLGERYTFIAGTWGGGEGPGRPDTDEDVTRRRTANWYLEEASGVDLDGSDAVLHVKEAETARPVPGA